MSAPKSSLTASAVDLNRENVQPLRAGRKAQDLAHALSLPSQQHKSELELRLRFVSHPPG